jgi:hypothetical protein
MFRFLPWKFLVQRAARHYGVMDPAMLMARMRRFAQPSEVAEPLELLRAGIVFHARGLVNSKAIQHNLDWVWPYWVEQQFNPESPSFVPRAFSFSHINLTHRNWTAVGHPDLALYPIVDSRGLVTPLHDGWSLDFWVISDTGQLLPSKLKDDAVRQSLQLEPELEVSTQCDAGGQKLDLATRLAIEEGFAPSAQTRIQAQSEQDGWLVVGWLNPCTPWKTLSVSLDTRCALSRPNLKMLRKTLMCSGFRPSRSSMAAISVCGFRFLMWWETSSMTSSRTSSTATILFCWGMRPYGLRVTWKYRSCSPTTPCSSDTPIMFLLILQP